MPTDLVAPLEVWPPVPQRGLDEVLRSWRGEGAVDQLVAALARIREPETNTLAERDWRPRDVRARANRVLFGLILPFVEQLPSDVRDWMEVLPAQSSSYAERSRQPLRSTS